MKKSNIIIALSATLLLAGCGEQNSKSLSASDFAEQFNAHVIVTRKAGTYEEQQPLDIDFGKDHVSFLGGSYGNVFYEKASNGGVNLVSLDVRNVKQTETVLGGTYAETFPNAFATIANDHKDEKEIALAEDNKLNEIGEEFKKTFSKVAPITNIKEAAGSIVFDENVSLKLTLKTDSDITYDFAATFDNPSAYKATKLDVLPETDASKALKAKLEAIKEGNYTVKIKEGETEKATLFVNSDRFLIDNEGTQKGYLKTDTGYKVLAVSGTTVSEEGSSTDLFSSLLPDYDFAPEVIVDEALSPFIEDGDPIEHLGFTVYPIDSFESETLKITDSGLVLTLVNNDVTTTFEWSNIGTTNLPIDISNITVKKTWTSEGYTEIDTKLKTLLGNDNELPFWDLADLGWKVDAFSQDKGTLSIVSDKFDNDSELTDAVALYAEVMKNAGFVELTEAERESIADFCTEFYLWGDSDDFKDYHIYHINSSFVEIVNNSPYNYYADDPTVAIYVSPDEGWTRS